METRPAVIETKRAFVVSVSGTSGAGKSSVIEKTAALLASAITLHFDDYVTLGNDIAEIRAWVDAGADLDAIKTPGLADDLRKLRSREAIHLPNTGRRIEPADVIILEEPFGRSRGELSSLIDFAVFIDAPADVALTRRLLREIETWQEEPGRLIGALDIQLKAYLAAGRDAYLAASRAARESADLVLDGMHSVDELAATLVGEIVRRA
jgi:uridine kinase